MLCCCSGDRAKYCVRYNRREVMLLPIIILTNIKHNVTRCQGQIGNFVPLFCGAGNLVGRAGPPAHKGAQGFGGKAADVCGSGEILRRDEAQHRRRTLCTAGCCSEVSSQKPPPSGDILREGVAKKPVVPHSVPVLIAAVDRHRRAVGHGRRHSAVQCRGGP